MKITPEQLEKIAAAAEAATPGPWEHARWSDGRSAAGMVRGGPGKAVCLAPPKNGDASNADFIALCNPATVLALVAAVEAAEASAKAANFLRIEALLAAEKLIGRLELIDCPATDGCCPHPELPRDDEGLSIFCTAPLFKERWGACWLKWAVDDASFTPLVAAVEAGAADSRRLDTLEAQGLLVYMAADKVWQSYNVVAPTLREIADGEIEALRIVDELCAAKEPLCAPS